MGASFDKMKHDQHYQFYLEAVARMEISIARGQ
jgi:hypothetical protein